MGKPAEAAVFSMNIFTCSKMWYKPPLRIPIYFDTILPLGLSIKYIKPIDGTCYFLIRTPVVLRCMHFI